MSTVPMVTSVQAVLYRGLRHCNVNNIVMIMICIGARLILVRAHDMGIFSAARAALRGLDIPFPLWPVVFPSSSPSPSLTCRAPG